MQLNRRTWLWQAGALTAGCGLCGCKSAPVTGRRQLIIVPESQELALGVQAFQETIDSEPASQDARLSTMVRRVGQRIANVAGRDDFEWEFRLIASESQNAFCLPGGKVAVYEGILPICVNEAGLAVVMSHEVAHALARHGGERMSQQLVSSGVKNVAEKVAGHYAPTKKDLLMQAYGVGTKYGVLLPYNRKQESEADHIGLNLMAEAGYDPTVAPAFWNRFGQLKGESKSEFLSTHPSDQRRAADLVNLMDRAKQKYDATKTKIGLGASIA